MRTIASILATAAVAAPLLGWAVVAFAETRWVLWDQHVVAVEGQEPAVAWLDWGSFPTKAACEEQRGKEVGHYEQMSKLFRNDWAKQGGTIIAKNEGNLLDAHESRQQCEIMRDLLRRAEESIYGKSAADYLQVMGQQPEAPVLSLRRYLVEMNYANVRTYVASRCVSRG